MNFLWPLRREYMELLGAVSCSRESIGYLISRPEGGNALVIVAGGAEEALVSQPDTHRIVLRKRKGFVKVAIQYGTALVPSYSFGEVDIFRQLKNEEGSTLRRIQNAIGNIFTFTTPLFYGRGALGLRFGFIPFQRPICTVVGCPIEIEKNENPTDEELSRVHDRYVSELLTLFEEHKSSFDMFSCSC
uniref:diacylglycerol O-acyltransferase n=1 Tax=Trichuris muris TaxID=70415 RepID=A0A5S6R0K4_TRIMR